MKKIAPILLLSSVLVILWFKDGLLLGAAESGLPFYSLGTQYEITRWAWAYPALGNITGIITASSLTYLVLSKVQELGISAVSIHAGVFWILFSTSGVFTYLWIRDLFPKLNYRYLMAGVVFYLFNPIFTVNVWSRFLYNFMFFWAFLPPTMYLLYRGIQRRELKYAIFSALLSVPFSYAMTSYAFVIILSGIFFYTIIFFFLLTRDKTFLFKYSLVLFSTFFLFNFWWITQSLNFLSTSAYSETIEEFFSSKGNLDILNNISKRLGGLSSILSFSHKSFVESGPRWAALYNNPIVRVVNFSFLMIGLLAFLKDRKRKKVLYLGILLTIAIFLMKGNSPPLGELYTFLFERFSFFQVFRNPFEKFGFVFVLALTPLFVVGLSKFGNKVLAFALFYILALWGYPYFSGLVFSIEEQGSYKVNVPSYYRFANQWLNKDESVFRFVTLPIGGEGITYSWGTPYSGVELTNTLLEKPGISFNTSVPFYHSVVTEMSKYQLNRDFLTFLPFLNTKYILLREDIDYKERRMPNPSDVKASVGQWEKEGLVTKRLAEGDLSIYELRPEYIWPKIYVSDNVLFTNERNLPSILAPDGFPNKKLSLLGLEDEQKVNLAGSTHIVPQVIFSPFLEGGFKDFSDQELIDNLFYTKHLPGDPLYPLIRIKEKLEVPLQEEFHEFLEYKTGILGKRAIEIYRLKNSPRLEDEYIQLLDEISSLIKPYIKDGNEVPTRVRDSILYQRELLQRVDSKLGDLVLDRLIEWRVEPEFPLPYEIKNYLIYRFKVESENKYFLRVDIPQKAIYLDGQPIEVSNSQPELFLSKGVHEIGLPVEKKDFLKEILHFDNEQITGKSNWEKDFVVPNEVKNYFLEFEFKYLFGDESFLSVSQNVDPSEEPGNIFRVKKDLDYHDWRNFSERFTSSNGVVGAKLIFDPVKRKVFIL